MIVNVGRSNNEKELDINSAIRVNAKIAYLMILNEKLKYVKSIQEVKDIEKICKRLIKEIKDLMEENND